MKDDRFSTTKIERRNGDARNFLTPSQSNAINGILSALVERIPARFTLLVSQTGQAITSLGETKDCNLATLGVLIASDYAASQEIARITGELRNYQMVLREGDRSHNFIVDAGSSLIIYVQVSSEIPLGWARMQIRDAAYMLEQATSQSNDNEIREDLDLSSREALDLFGQALDDLWTG